MKAVNLKIIITNVVLPEGVSNEEVKKKWELKELKIK